MGLICPSWLSETLWETVGIGTEFHTKKYFLKSNSSSDVLIETQRVDWSRALTDPYSKFYLGDLASPHLYISYSCSSYEIDYLKSLSLSFTQLIGIQYRLLLFILAYVILSNDWSLVTQHMAKFR